MVNLPLVAAAQEDAKEKPLLAAQDIIDRHIEMLGGGKKLASAKSLQSTGEIYYKKTDEKGTIQRYFESGKYYVKINLPDYGVLEQGYDGKVAWRNLRGKYFLLKDQEKTNFQLTCDKIFEVLNYTMAYEGEYETKEIVKVKGRPAYRVQFEPKNGLPYERYFDTENFRLVKTGATQISLGVSMNVTEECIDFVTVDGFLIWGKQQSFVSGTETYTIELKKIEFNEPIDQSVFELPAEVKELADAKPDQLPTEDF